MISDVLIIFLANLDANHRLIQLPHRGLEESKILLVDVLLRLNLRPQSLVELVQERSCLWAHSYSWLTLVLLILNRG